MVKLAEHKSIGLIHGSLLLHEALHEPEINQHEHEIEEAEHARHPHEEIVHSPDIRSERKVLNKEEGLCFKTFCAPFTHHNSV